MVLSFIFSFIYLIHFEASILEAANVNIAVDPKARIFEGNYHEH